MKRSTRRTHKLGSQVVVKSSRDGRKLMVDRTFASWYEPGSSVTGSVWDAIAAPVLALPAKRRRSALILGLAGGSVARLLRALAPDLQIVGVELNEEVVDAARRWFDLDSLGVEVVVDDAQDFLRRERRRFDLIVEDIFVGQGADVHKPEWLPDPGHTLAYRRLREGGLMVSNALDEKAFISASLQSLFPSVVQLEVEDYDNRVFVGSSDSLSARALRRAVADAPLLQGLLPRLRLRTVCCR